MFMENEVIYFMVISNMEMSITFVCGMFSFQYLHFWLYFS